MALNNDVSMGKQMANVSFLASLITSYTKKKKHRKWLMWNEGCSSFRARGVHTRETQPGTTRVTEQNPSELSNIAMGGEAWKTNTEALSKVMWQVGAAPTSPDSQTVNNDI